MVMMKSKIRWQKMYEAKINHEHKFWINFFDAVTIRKKKDLYKTPKYKNAMQI